ncbi:MAG: alpha/beta fold hydrolase [archaeon]|nr:alpha/beta fold hydrolase [archaeon]
MEKLFFKDSKGNKLCAILSNPAENTSNPIIILCHGFTTSKDNFTNRTLEKILNEKEIATFRFDFFAHGESEGKFEDVTVSKAVDDILSAIKFVKNAGYKKIGLFGSSFGGIASIIAASKSNDLYILALKSPVSKFEEQVTFTMTKQELSEWKKKGYKEHISGAGKKFRLNYTFFEDFKNNDGYKVAKKIKIPTIIVHGGRDKEVNIEQSQKISKIIKNCELQIIELADHSYTNPAHFENVIKLISDFVIEHS